jgi:hypothetical protein
MLAGLAGIVGRTLQRGRGAAFNVAANGERRTVQPLPVERTGRYGLRNLSTYAEGGDPAAYGRWDSGDDIRRAFDDKGNPLAGSTLRNFSLDNIQRFNKDGYGEIERLALDEGRPLTLDALIQKARIRDADAAGMTKTQMADTLRGMSGRSGTVEDPSAGLRRIAALGQTAAQVGARNTGIRGALERNRTAQATGLGYADQFDQIAYDQLGSQVNSIISRDLRDKQKDAAKDAGKMGAIGTGISTALSVASMFAAGGSSRAIKDTIGPMEPGVLEKIADLDVDRWRYKGDEIAHVGPYAEDFNQAFKLDGDGVIYYLDALGVLFAAVKELTTEVKRLENELAERT